MQEALSSPKLGSNPSSHVLNKTPENGLIGLCRKTETVLIDLETLRSLQTGSFGRAWVDFLERYHLKPQSGVSRRQQLIEGIHVLTNYEFDAAGKAQVCAFIAGAKLTPLNIGQLLWLILWSQPDHSCSGEQLWQAYQRGRHSLFDPDDWQPELLWDLPLEYVQTLFRV